MHTRGLWAREETEVNYLENSEKKIQQKKLFNHLQWMLLLAHSASFKRDIVMNI